jgi:hypothetical protein
MECRLLFRPPFVSSIVAQQPPVARAQEWLLMQLVSMSDARRPHFRCGAILVAKLRE